MRLALGVLSAACLRLYLFAALPATDSFNRPDQSPIGGNWSVEQGSIELFSNQYKSGTPSPSVARWNADTFDSNQYAQAQITAGAQSWFAGVAVRIAGGAATYYCAITGSGGVLYLIRYNSGNPTTLGAIAQGPAVIRLEVTGSSSVDLTVKADGITVLTYSDTSASRITSGSAGIATEGLVGASGDDWQGGNLGSSGPPARRRIISL